VENGGHPPLAESSRAMDDCLGGAIRLLMRPADEAYSV